MDLDEYVDFLDKLYSRVTWKVAITDGVRNHILPTFEVRFPVDELKLASNAQPAPVEEDNEDWKSCVSGEDNDPDFDYKYEEDEEKNDVKKYKRAKKIANKRTALAMFKDPIQYEETIVYKLDKLDDGFTIIDELIESEYCLPLGYPAEQMLN